MLKCKVMELEEQLRLTYQQHEDERAAIIGDAVQVPRNVAPPPRK